MNLKDYRNLGEFNFNVSTKGIFFCPCPLQEVVCNSVSGRLPVTVQSSCLLSLPSLHRRLLCRGKICFRQLRPRQAQRLSQHHSEFPPQPAATYTVIHFKVVVWIIWSEIVSGIYPQSVYSLQQIGIGVLPVWRSRQEYWHTSWAMYCCGRAQQQMRLLSTCKDCPPKNNISLLVHCIRNISTTTSTTLDYFRHTVLPQFLFGFRLFLWNSISFICEWKFQQILFSFLNSIFITCPSYC